MLVSEQSLHIPGLFMCHRKTLPKKIFWVNSGSYIEVCRINGCELDAAIDNSRGVTIGLIRVAVKSITKKGENK